jgi:2-methylcitrate dehydratase
VGDDAPLKTGENLPGRPPVLESERDTRLRGTFLSSTALSDGMPSTAELATFATDVSFERLPETVRQGVKRRVLDAVGVAIGRLEQPPADAVRRAVTRQNTSGGSRLWGSEHGSGPADAAMDAASLVASGNGATFLAPTLSATHGSVAAVLSAAEARSAWGEDILAGLAVAHEIHGEFAWNAPIDGFHPATHASIAATAGIGRAMDLDRNTVANAIDLAASRMTLAVGDGEFETVALGSAAHTAVYACLLAENGLGGPDSLTGSDGWHDLVGPFEVDLDPGCERVLDAAIRPYDAHPYAQSAIEAAITLAEDAALDPATVEAVRVETIADAVSELEANTVAAALVDREVTTRPGERADLRPVADVVEISALDEPAERAERGELPASVVVECHDGERYEASVQRFTGHPSKPASWGVVEEKFHALADARYDLDRRAETIETVRGLEAETAAELSRLLD